MGFRSAARSAYVAVKEKPVQAVSVAGHALSQGASTASSVTFSALAKTDSLLPSAILGIAVGAADAISTAGFQGPSVMESGSKSENEPQEMTILRGYFTPSSSSEPVPEILHYQHRHRIPQVAYSILDLIKIAANRYFLWDTLQIIFAFDMGPVAFSLLIVFDTLIRGLFGMTNETYETLEVIAQMGVEKDQDSRAIVPFYKSLLTSFSKYPRAVELFKWVGAAEHVLVDDTLPWLAFFPRSSIEYIENNSWIQILIGSLGVAVAMPLIVLMYAQTYLFEGRHTDENVLEIKEPLTTSQRITKVLLDTMPIMGPVHGAATAAPVYVVLRDNIKGPAKWPVAVCGALFSFMGTTNGILRSEVREAMEDLKKRLAEFEASRHPERVYSVL